MSQKCGNYITLWYAWSQLTVNFYVVTFKYNAASAPIENISQLHTAII